jgi:hypothetical protein
MNIQEFSLGDDDDREDSKPVMKSPRSMYFIRKYAELQLLMLQHNAGLTASHPYASSPINWPFLLSGISFWTETDSKKQIYFIGNIIGWWVCSIALSIYIGILGADLLARRRAMDPIPDREQLSFRRYILSPQFCLSCSKSSLEQCRILPPDMGRPLRSFLPNESSTFRSSLSSVTRGFRAYCWCSPKFCAQRDNQLSYICSRS